MSRGFLDRAILNAIDESLPQVLPFTDVVLGLSPDLLSRNFEPTDYTPVATVCFQDCAAVLAQIRIALFEFFAHGTYYRDACQPPKTMEALFFEKFFIEDATFRLYSAGEHLANASAFMLNLADADLKPHRRRRASLQTVVAAYLSSEWPTSCLAAKVLELGGAESWRFAMRYRNRVVHEQPPTVSGLGMSYRRHLRWVVSADKSKRRLDITSGDRPEYDIGSISGHVLAANDLFIRTANAILEEYFEVLEQHSIRREGDTLVVDLPK